MQSNLFKAAMITGSLLFTSLAAHAAPVTTYNGAVTEWAVGCLCQPNDHWTVTTDASFGGSALELGLRAQQRRVGSIAPSPLASSNYLVQAGSDPTQASRAWWNFDVAVTYMGGLSSLDSLTLRIVKSSGTNSDGGLFDLLNPALFLATNADITTPTLNEYKASENPTFAPWFSPTYSVSNTDPFSYLFFLTATVTNQETRETTSVTTQMCVHTDGVNCVPEPSSFSMMGVMGAMLALFGFAGFMRRRQVI